MTGVAHQKVNAGHLKRNAYLYVRQSTLRQVFENTESTKRQYGLRQHAVALGWPVERIIVIDSDLAYAASAYRLLERQALALAAEGPLTPAAFRDASGTSRKYVMAILEDLGRRGILRRTPDGHLPGPRAALEVRP